MLGDGRGATRWTPDAPTRGIVCMTHEGAAREDNPGRR